MNRDHHSTRARRYLLGEATDQESAALELDYFSDESASDAVAAAEEDLVEDYLSGRLGADEAMQFERVYLVSPQHQTRVDTIRRLMAAAKPAARVIPIESGVRPPARTPRGGTLQWLLLAAATMVLAVGAAWILRQPSGGGPGVAENRPPPLPSTPPAVPPAPDAVVPLPTPRVFAMSISPIAVRSPSQSPSLIIPAGTDTVALRLEGEAPVPRPARVVVRTVSGDEIWRGPVAAASDPGAVARADIPAAQLRPEDYIVELFGTDAAGVERERYRYYLKVRSR